MANFSSAFGWTLAGSAVNSDQLDATCANITNTGHGHWAAEGLIPEYIVEPICNQSGSNPNASYALPWVLHYSTEVFTTQLLHAFAPSKTDDAMDYLCDNLRYLLLDQFYMQETRIINATCNAAGTKMNPRPEQASAAINSTITDAYFDAFSTLYGLLFASSAVSDSMLNVYCAHSASHTSALNKMLLNGARVASTICGVKEPMSTDDGFSAIKTWSTKIFLTIIENASNVSGWLPWLCDNLDADALGAVGLNGQAVHTQVCSDAKSAA